MAEPIPFRFVGQVCKACSAVVISGWDEVKSGGMVLRNKCDAIGVNMYTCDGLLTTIPTVLLAKMLNSFTGDQVL